MTNGEAVAIADRIVLAVCEIPDRNSPDDQPEMMLVTPEELRAIVCAALVETVDSSVPKPGKCPCGCNYPDGWKQQPEGK